METHHHGALLADVIRRRNTNISELCRKIKVNRRTLYNWFRREKLDPEVIFRIGNVIHYDFSKEFETEFLQNKIHYSDQGSIESHFLDKSVTYWQNKCESLMQQYVAYSGAKFNKESSVSPKSNSLPKKRIYH